MVKQLIWGGFFGRAAVSVLATAATLAAASAVASVPAVSLIEGQLTSAGGSPAADGNYAIKVGLYKDAVGGAPLWSEQANIASVGGQFQHPLGSVAALSQTVLQTAAYIGIAVGSDPELPRKPLHAVLYAARAGAAESLACSGCVVAGNLEPGLAAAVQGAVKSSELADVAKSGAYADLLGTPNLSGFAKTADLKKVALTGAYADLSGAPLLPKAGDACGSGLVVKGLKADGSLDCTQGGGGGDLAAISNGMIANTFTETKSGTKDVQIPDFAGPGVTDTLDFPDIGNAQKIWVAIDMSNSDMSSIKIELYGPSMSSPYLIYNGGKNGNSLTTNFNTDTPILLGDMDKDWLGKNIKGLWSLTVKDGKDNVAGNIDGKFNWSMNVQTVSNKKLQIKGDLYVDGKVFQGGSQPVSASTEFQICSLPDKQGPCIANVTQLRTFLGASQYCASLKADVCTDSQTTAFRKNSPYVWQPGWTNSYADNDGGQWNIANGGTGDDHSANSFYSTPCCYNVTPPQQGEQTIAGIRVLKVNNNNNTTWSDAVDACLSVNADLCDKGQYWVLRNAGAITAAMWASDHSDNDGGVCNSSVGGTSDDTNPSQTYGYACCATSRTSLTCPAPNIEVNGVCVAKIFNSNSYTFTQAAASCAGMGARICSISQSAVLRNAGQLTASANWTASHSDSDGNQNNVGVGGAQDNPNDGNGYAYACCY